MRSSSHCSYGGNKHVSIYHASTHYKYNCLTNHIIDCRIPKSLEKMPKLGSYDGYGDPNEHVEHMDTIINYHQARKVMKFKLFVMTLKRAGMT